MRRRLGAAWRPAALALAAGILLLAGCSSKFQSFPFETPEGAQIGIWQTGRASRDQEALFRPGGGRRASPVYHLAAPVTVSSRGESFAFSYTSDLTACTLKILSDPRTTLAEASLPPTSGNPVRFLVPLEAGSRIWGYRLEEAPGGPGGSLTMRGAGILAFLHGFSIDGNLLTVDGSVEVLSASSSGATARITDAARRRMEDGLWLVRLTLADGAAGGRVEFRDPLGATAVFEVNAASTPGWLDFARGSLPFLPREVIVSGSLRSLQILQVPPDAPLPADPGQILDWDRASWRKPDYELFAWSRFPRILIMDTASYEVQAAFFKRLAFYVEKKGHAGRLESFASLAGLHGYNAHDYRAEDLARFFTAVHGAGDESPEEAALEGILLQNGVLKKTTSGDAPAEGCILSISRSSPRLLRSLLLTHEAFHGLFFTMPAFREATEKEWSSLSPAEQDLWVQYLGVHGYDTTDHYLVVNEFQSYLMQQNRSHIWGFQDETLSRMKASGGRGAALARRLLASHPSSFLDSFDALDTALQAAGGPPGGEAMSIRRVER